MSWVTRVKSFFGVNSADTAPETEDHVASEPVEGGFKYTKAIVTPTQPVLRTTGYSELGGIQGLDWFLKTLRRDAFGILSHFFLQEDTTGALQVEPSRPAIVLGLKGHLAVRAGNLHLDSGNFC